MIVWLVPVSGPDAAEQAAAAPSDCPEHFPVSTQFRVVQYQLPLAVLAAATTAAQMRATSSSLVTYGGIV
jgi:hypothetical protein